MSNRAKATARQRQKRAEKKRDTRRAFSGSPYRRIGDSSQPMTCYVNQDFHEKGLASLLVLRRAQGGGHAMAAFLIDRWCIGLKDAWGRLEITADEFNSMLDRSRGHMQIERMEPDAARRMVAAAIRFSHENGFRLPARYERWLALLGGVGDWRTADINDFGVDGGLRYVGDEEGLRSRLLVGTPEEFFRRNNAHYIMRVSPNGLPPELDAALGEALRTMEPLGTAGDAGIDDDEPDDDEIEETAAAVEEAAASVRARMLDGVRKWCFWRRLTPHARLPEAVELMTEAMLQIRGEDDLLNAPEERLANLTTDNIVRLLSFESRADSDQLTAALTQLGEYADHFESPEAMMAAIGLDNADGTTEG